jgi:hypothetical protein
MESPAVKQTEDLSFFKKQKALMERRQRVSNKFDACIEHTPINTADPVTWWLDDTHAWPLMCFQRQP